MSVPALIKLLQSFSVIFSHRDIVLAQNVYWEISVLVVQTQNQTQPSNDLKNCVLLILQITDVTDYCE